MFSFKKVISKITGIFNLPTLYSISDTNISDIVSQLLVESLSRKPQQKVYTCIVQVVVVSLYMQCVHGRRPMSENVSTLSIRDMENAHCCFSTGLDWSNRVATASVEEI